MKKYSVSLVAAMVLLFSGFAIAYDEPKYDSNFLLSVLFKVQGLREQAMEEIRKLDIEIKNNEATIQKSKQIIDLASQRTDTNAKQAKAIAREALIKAQEAKRKNEETKKEWGLKKMRADSSYATIHNMLSKNLGSGRQIKGFMTDYTGRVDIFKANGDKASPENGFIEPGDKVWTYGDSSAEIQMLDGRATAKIGPYSEFVMKEDTPQEQVVELLKGKVYMAVDKADDYYKMLKEKYKPDIQTIKEADSEDYKNALKLYNQYLQTIKDADTEDYKKAKWLFEMRLWLNSPNAAVAVRGTKFVVELKENKATEVTVLEGIVDVSDRKGEKKVAVEGGYKVIATSDGISEPQKFENIARWWER